MKALQHLLPKQNVMTHLGAFEGVDQTAFPNVREADDADGYALRRARLVRFKEAE